MYSVCVYGCVVWLRSMSSDNSSFQASLWCNDMTDRQAGVECGKTWTAEATAGPEITSVNLVYITLIQKEVLKKYFR